MTKRVRTLLTLMIATAVMGLASCDHYNCAGGAQFGASSCTQSQGGNNTSGTPVAFVFVDNQQGSTIDGYTMTKTTFDRTPFYQGPTVGANIGSVGIVVAQNKYVFAVYEDLGLIYGFSIDASGMLLPLSTTPVTVSVPSVGFNQDVVITNPTGTMLFISSANSGQIYAFQIGTGGTLTAATGSPFLVSFAPQNMAMDGQGKFLYVSPSSSNHVGTFVEGFSVQSSGPALVDLGQFPFAMWEMQGEPSGKYMVGITGETKSVFGSDDDHIHVLNVDSTLGTLTEGSSSPFTTTYAPFYVAVQPKTAAGAFVYSFSINDPGTAPNATEGYQLDPTNGALNAVTGSPFTLLGLSAWGKFDPNGGYLFEYSLQSITAYQLGSTGGLTQIGAIGLTTGGYWAVADVQ